MPRAVDGETGVVESTPHHNPQLEQSDNDEEINVKPILSRKNHPCNLLHLYYHLHPSHYRKTFQIS
jgi:hypothetical protein